MLAKLVRSMNVRKTALLKLKWLVIHQHLNKSHQHLHQHLQYFTLDFLLFLYIRNKFEKWKKNTVLGFWKEKMKTLNKIQKCTEITENRQMRQTFSVVYPGFSLGIQFFGKQKAARPRESRLQEQGPREKLPYLHSESCLNMLECSLSWQLQA